MSTYTAEACTRDIAQFEIILTELQKRLNAPVLDGTPFILVLPEEGIPLAHQAVYGTPYDDQKTGIQTMRCFRMQRGFTLCGAISMSEESARRSAEKAAGAGHPVKIVHSREWLQSCRDGVFEAINALKKYKNTLLP